MKTLLAARLPFAVAFLVVVAGLLWHGVRSR